MDRKSGKKKKEIKNINIFFSLSYVEVHLLIFVAGNIVCVGYLCTDLHPE